MSYRVTYTRKDWNDNIVAIGGEWGQHSREKAVQNILTNSRFYYVRVNGREVYVRAVLRDGSYYLTTSPDGYSPNNLDDLSTR